MSDESSHTSPLPTNAVKPDRTPSKVTSYSASLFSKTFCDRPVPPQTPENHGSHAGDRLQESQPQNSQNVPESALAPSHDNKVKQETKSLKGEVAGTGSTSEEALRGLIGGALFGMVSPVVGHPFDTVKTKMQGEMPYKNMKSVSQVVKHIYIKGGGMRAFYQGFLPPLVGSAFYRSVLFSSYAATFSACQRVPSLSEPIPYTGGLRMSVILGACAAGFARATIESPFEFIKVRKQVGSSWQIKHPTSSTSSLMTPQYAAKQIANLYQGYIPTLQRTVLLLGSFFVLADYSVRYIPDVINAPLLGPFFKGGICATAAWGVAFPMETVKNVMQTDTTHQYSKSITQSNGTVVKQKMSSMQLLAHLYKTQGITSLYRGFVPGASRSFVANGVSMIVYTWFQDATR
jgi:solute carrier family 25 carnitine/acylcarnitine transporter 20/29